MLSACREVQSPVQGLPTSRCMFKVSIWPQRTRRASWIMGGTPLFAASSPGVLVLADGGQESCSFVCAHVRHSPRIPKIDGVEPSDSPSRSCPFHLKIDAGRNVSWTQLYDTSGSIWMTVRVVMASVSTIVCRSESYLQKYSRS